MAEPGLPTRFTRRLGFRLTAGYLLFFAFLLTLVGVYFRSTLIEIQESQVREQVEEDWATLGRFLKPSGAGLMWDYNPDSPQDSFIVERLQRVLMLADEDGNLIQVSAAYRVIGVEPPDEIRRVLQSREPTWRLSHDPWGTNYMIRLGTLVKPDGRRYFVAQGRNMALNDATVRQFSWRYFAGLPVLVLFGGLLGWFLTRHALQPLQEVVRASESITGSNLSLRIPLREAG
ncbi:MAG TPA: hypothetical protein VLH09_09320, partial [Bryobacteraceae bacterium]|nr:hypothetical protein [Bryobacteraceae bacterium]